MLHQFHRMVVFNQATFKDGLKLLAWGIFKKVVIADNLATYVDPVFQDPKSFESGSIAIAVIFFYFQIYCDFSGYTDIARGASRMLGFELMKNFNLPFLATSLTDFWKRWHISLSSWLRDYVYEPLALSWRDAGIKGIALALISTFILSGIWHGAEWTFVIWGLGHGIALVIELICTKIFKVKNRIFTQKIGDILGTFRTFILVSLSYIFFRSQNLDNALQLLQGLLDIFFEARQWIIVGPFYINFNQVSVVGHSLYQFLTMIGLVIGMILLEKAHSENKIRDSFNALPRHFQLAIYQVFLIILITHGHWFTKHASFIYFQF